MKAIVLIVVFFFAGQLYAQEDTTVYDIVDQEAEFPGGAAAMMKWIQSNFNYPTCLENDIEISNRIYIEFIIEKDGSINHVSVRTKCNSCKESAINLMKTSPIWLPAYLNGSKVRSFYRIPLNIDFD